MTWLHAPDLLLANDDSYLDSDCCFSPRAKAQTLLARASLCITQGFIARNHEGETVLLGRGGSDTSATLLAGGLNARRCEIWSDVPGFYSTDPRRIPQAKLIKKLSCAEAQEIALMGAKVLHPRAIAPLVAAQVELQLCSLQNPDVQGTQVSSRPATDTCLVKAGDGEEPRLAAPHGKLEDVATGGFFGRHLYLLQAASLFSRSHLHFGGQHQRIARPNSPRTRDRAGGPYALTCRSFAPSPKFRTVRRSASSAEISAVFYTNSARCLLSLNGRRCISSRNRPTTST